MLTSIKRQNAMSNSKVFLGILRIYIGVFVLIKFVFRGISAVQVDIDRGMGIGELTAMLLVIILILFFCIYELWTGINEIRRKEISNKLLQFIGIGVSLCIIVIGTVRLVFSFKQTGIIDIFLTTVLVLGLTIVSIFEIKNIRSQRTLLSRNK